MGIQKKPTPEMEDLLRKSGSNNYNIAVAAQAELAKALTLPLRRGVLKGDITANIFNVINFLPGQSTEFAMDIVSPGTEGSYTAYTIPNIGRIPEKHVEGDYVMVPTFDVGGSVDYGIKFARDARWDVASRALAVLEAMFIRKNNSDAWRVLLAAGQGRNIMVYDNAATAGLFTKRLVALMRTVMRRNAGGNSTSTNQGRLTDLYLSPENLEDIRSWDLTQIDEVTRREIFISDGGPTGEQAIARIFGVNLHDIDEFGVGQEFQTYYTGTLAGTMSTDKVEIVVGLDLVNNDSFVRPVRSEVEVFEDPGLHRQRRVGYYAFAEGGWASLDSRRVLLGAN